MEPNGIEKQISTLVLLMAMLLHAADSTRPSSLRTLTTLIKLASRPGTLKLLEKENGWLVQLVCVEQARRQLDRLG